MDIKALSIQVQAKGVQQAANALGSLAKNAAQLDPVLTKAKAGLDNISKISLGSTNLQINSTSESITRLRNTTKDFSNIGQGFKGLSNAMTSTASAVEKLVGSTAGLQAFNTQLQSLKTTLSEMKGMSGVLRGIGQSAANASSRQAGGGGTGGGRQAASEAEKLAKVQQRLIQNIEREAVITSQGKVAWLEMQAARKGVSEKAAPFIAQLRAQQEGLKQGEMSTRAYTAALRQVPAQFTDIATQLAGGQNPMLVLLQQGGQLKDMFGTVGNAAKAAGTYIMSLLTNPIVLASVAVAGLTYALYKGSSEFTDFNKAVILSGGALGMTKEGFYSLTAEISRAANVSRGFASDVLTQLASQGGVARDNMASLSVTISKFAKATGQDTKDVVGEFAKLSSGPTKGIEELDKKYKFLTVATYAQIRALEEQGRTQEALTLAQNTFKGSADEMAAKVSANFGFIEKFAKAATTQAKEYLDILLEIGRDRSLEQNVDFWKKVDKNAGALNIFGVGFKLLAKERTAYAENELRVGKAVEDAANGQAAAAAKVVEAEQKRKNAFKAVAEAQGGVRNATERTNQAIEQAKNRHAALNEAMSGMTEEQKKALLATGNVLSLEEEIARIREKNADKGAGAQVDRLAGLKAEQQAIELDIANLREFGSAYDKVTENAKKLFTINNQLADNRTDPKKRKDLLEEKALLEQITQVEQTRNSLIESAKGAQKWDEIRSKSIAATEGINDHIDALRAGEAETARMTATQKLLAQAEDEAAYSMDMMTRSAAANSVRSLRNQVAAESLAKAEQEVSNIKKETAVINEKGSASVESLIAKYKEEEASVSLSNQQREKRSALLEIEKQRAQSVAVLQAELKQLSTQDTKESKLKTAAINEQITALNNQAAAQARVVAAQPDRKSLEGSSIGQDALGAFNSLYDGMQTRQQLMADFFSQSYSTMSDALTNFTTTGKLDFKSFTASVLKMISEMMVKMLLLKAIQYGVSAFGGGSSAATGAGTNVSYSAGQFAKGGMFGAGVHKFANGGMFTNSVVSRPTPFKFANGAGFSNGVMGEAGPEAVMPLTRGPNGKLGVQASGGGGGNNITINVVVNSDSSSQTTTEGTSEQDGKMLGDMIKQSVISVIMEQKRPGGVLAA